MANVAYNSFAQSNIGGYIWTGLNNENQIWSKLNVTKAMMCNSINCRYAGYGQTCYTVHCIWDAHGNLVAQSGTMTVASQPAGGGNDTWINASISDTYLAPGTYNVGIWCNPNYSRWWTQWYNGTVDNDSYMLTATSGVAAPTSYTGADSHGVMATQVAGYDAGATWIQVNGTWQHGQAWINVNGSWYPSKNIWTNVNGTWQKGI